MTQPPLSASQQAMLEGIEEVVADRLRFKAKLAFGENAYASLRSINRGRELWDLLGAAGAGGSVASSSLVASTFFAPSGLLGLLGIGTAVTPIGWVAVAALASGWWKACQEFVVSGNSVLAGQRDAVGVFDQPRRDVAPVMQHPPDLYAVPQRHVEDDVGVAAARPAAQARDAQFVCPPGRPGVRCALDLREGPLHGADKAFGSRSRYTQVVVHRLPDVTVCLLSP